MIHLVNISKLALIAFLFVFSNSAFNAEFKFGNIMTDKILLGEGSRGKAYLSLYDDHTSEKEKLLAIKEVKLSVQKTRKFANIANEICANYELSGSSLIANSFGVSVDNNNLIFAMEPLLGSDLSNAIKYLDARRDFINTEWIKLVIARVALGIEYLHQKQWVWGDVKGDNIFIDYQTGYPKIGDFGENKRIGTSSLFTKTRDWGSLGLHVLTPLYLLVKSSDADFGSLLIEAIDKLMPGPIHQEIKGKIYSLSEIKELALFKDFDWQGAENGSLASGFIPIKSPNYLRVAFDDQTALEIDGLSREVQLLKAGSFNGFTMDQSVLAEINETRSPETPQIKSVKDFCVSYKPLGF